MKKKHTPTGKIVNRRARHDYELDDSLVVGVVLTGKEAKALRMGHGQLRGAYVTVKDGELWLINSTINSTNTFVIEEADQTRSRKLLAKSKEISGFISAKQQGRTIVPMEFLTAGRHIKLRIAMGKGKKRYDKRETIKKRDQSRDALRNLKH
jgi:SsrA-binding protein